MSNPNLAEAIDPFPFQVKSFFNKLDMHPDYECKIKDIQLQIFFRGAKVGGLNRKIKEWYFSKVFVVQQKSFGLLQKSSFEFRIKPGEKGEHQYWSCKGLDNYEKYEEPLIAMTRVPL